MSHPRYGHRRTLATVKNWLRNLSDRWPVEDHELERFPEIQKLVTSLPLAPGEQAVVFGYLRSAHRLAAEGELRAACQLQLRILMKHLDSPLIARP